jgi:hypothetical protein
MTGASEYYFELKYKMWPRVSKAFLPLLLIRTHTQHTTSIKYLLLVLDDYYTLSYKYSTLHPGIRL